ARHGVCGPEGQPCAGRDSLRGAAADTMFVGINGRLVGGGYLGTSAGSRGGTTILWPRFSLFHSSHKSARKHLNIMRRASEWLCPLVQSGCVTAVCARRLAYISPYGPSGLPSPSGSFFAPIHWALNSESAMDRIMP